MLKTAWESHEALGLNLKNEAGFSRRHKGEEPSRQSGRLREHGIKRTKRSSVSLEGQGQRKQGVSPPVCQILFQLLYIDYLA